MPALSTQYMNLSLKNPILVSSSGLTKSVDKIKNAESAGAGAVVLKSMFEEVLAQQDLGLSDSATMHAEAMDYLRAELNMQYGPRDYCELIDQAKSTVSIPVIASINCVSDKWWPNFAMQIQEAGADALELNVFKSAVDPKESSQDIEEMYYNIVKIVKEKINIPVALKIGPYFSALPNLVSKLDALGADAIVLFNRFTEPDIDIDKLELKTTFDFSSQYEIHRTLRWTALVSGNVGCDVSATGGVKTAKDVIKLLLAGASTVQLASVLYENGVNEIDKMLKEVQAWMLDKGFESISDFKGKLSFAKTESPQQYLRAQFMEKIRGVE